MSLFSPSRSRTCSGVPLPSSRHSSHTPRPPEPARFPTLDHDDSRHLVRSTLSTTDPDFARELDRSVTPTAGADQAVAGLGDRKSTHEAFCSTGRG